MEGIDGEYGNLPQLATAEGGATSKILPGGFSKGCLRALWSFAILFFYQIHKMIFNL
jgi:hypothetical protein